MEHLYSRDMRTELEEVDRMLRCSLLPWWERIQVFIRKSSQETTWKSLPAAVVAVYRYLGIDREESMAMATIFKMVFLANSIHEVIKDDEEGQIYDQNMQFTILIGDYFFGRILKMLVDVRADEHLDLLANTICQMNEGAVMYYKMDVPYDQVLSKTRASLYEAAFLTAARTAAVPSEYQESYRVLGLHMGMALEMMENDNLKLECQAHIKTSEDIFRGMNQRYNLKNSTLEKMIREMGQPSGNIARAAI